MFRTLGPFWNAEGAAATAAAPTGDAAAAAAGASETAAAAGAAASEGAAAAAVAAPVTGAAADEKPAAGATAAAAATVEPPARVVPDKYALTVPEGGFVDKSDLDAVAVAAKAKGLTNEEAQQVANDVAAANKARSEAFLAELKAHPEVGGDKLPVAQQRANAVLDRFWPANTAEGAALRAGLTKTGYGNFAPFIVGLARIGRAMSEDAPPNGGAATGRRSAAEILFGDAKS